jgi:DNA-binding GntR family transcriptional regulator
VSEVSSKFVSQGKAATAISPRHRLIDEAYEAIKTMIIANELTSGQVISVAALADHLGVSRSPVSKAVTALEQDGFIESEPFKAPRVATLTVKFIRDVYDVRVDLEARAAALGVARLTDKDRGALEEGLTTLEEAHARGDVDAVFRFDGQLHRLLADRSDNELLAGFLRNLDGHLVRVRNVYAGVLLSKPEADMQKAEITRVAHAAIARDVQGAETAMREHVSHHAQRLISQIEEGNE